MKKIVNRLVSDLTKQLCLRHSTGGFNPLRTHSTHEQAARAESWWLLEKLTNKTQTELIEQGEITLTAQAWKTLNTWITERIEQHKPLQYIIGTVPFCDLEIIVKPPILIPRPETEEWTSWLIEQLASVKNQKLTILDIGAGSGCIALALARALPYATVIGIDSNIDAVALSKRNKEHNNIANALFLRSDLYQELAQYKNSFDLIVSNPAYITYEEYQTLSKDVSEWEDKNALVATDNGFAMHTKILNSAKQYLKPTSPLTRVPLTPVPLAPRIVLEFGKGQEKHLEQLFAEAGFTAITTYNDLEQVPRWTTATV